MQSRTLRRSSLLLAAVLAAGCGTTAKLSIPQTAGPAPALASPTTSLIPTINVVDAKGWPDPATTPIATTGTTVAAFARELDHPRWLYVLPNGDVLVAETNAPPRPEDGKGIKGWFFKRYQKKAGGAVPSANRITLLRDTNHDGVADVRTVFMSGLNSPFGMALVGDTLYVANTDALVRVPYRTGQTQITSAPIPVTDLPAGPLNHHWTKNVIASPDGSKLYVSVGSNSNIAENGIDQEEGRAAIWEVDRGTGSKRIFVPFKDGQPSGQPIDVLTGFITDEGDAMGRPVGVAIDSRGALLVADDVGNTIWRVSKTQDPVVSSASGRGR